MSKAYNSPTARLLQSSRLFSLPRPLPPAALETPSSTGQYRASETATAYYPTHQAIATPSSSHFRGDWGLKRAIPGKTTKSSTPSIRLLAQDTPEHITDFESAADHERSRQKFAEMGVHITTREGGKSMQSVYEDFLDNTDPDAAKTTGAGSGGDEVAAQRWKYAGPWIAGMQEGEFQRYVHKQLATRKEEWTELVIDFYAEKRFEEERRAAQVGGRHFGPRESARPSMQAEMGIEQAEKQARHLYQRALETGDDADESKAKEEGERLVAQAKREAEEYQLEEQRWEAPVEAKRIMANAERSAAVQRNGLKAEEAKRNDPENRDVDLMTVEQINEQYSQIDTALTRAAEQVGRILEATEQTTYSNVYPLLRSAETAIAADKASRTTIQESWENSLRSSLRPTPQETTSLSRQLRESFKSGPLSSDLSNLVVKFLDMPPVYNPNTTLDPLGLSSSFSSHLSTEYDIGSTDRAPPTTHPAAGLSYLRTNAIMENHPTQGPLAQRSAISARVLRARNGARGPAEGGVAQLGVGGFVAPDSKSGGVGRSSSPSSGDPADALDDITPGGGKLYVHPLSATIDETGRVVLKTVRADDAAIAVKNGTEAVEEHDERRRAGSALGNPVMPLPLGSSMRRGGSGGPGGFGMGEGRGERLVPRANYGTQLPDLKQLRADEAKYGRQERGLGGGRDGREAEGDKAYQRIAELAGIRR